MPKEESVAISSGGGTWVGKSPALFCNDCQSPTLTKRESDKWRDHCSAVSGPSWERLLSNAEILATKHEKGGAQLFKNGKHVVFALIFHADGDYKVTTANKQTREMFLERLLDLLSPKTMPELKRLEIHKPGKAVAFVRELLVKFREMRQDIQVIEVRCGGC